MRIYHGLDGLRRIPTGGAMSIGNFDGMHLGHARIIETCRRVCADRAGTRVQIVTFEPHPLTVLRPEAAPPRLSPSDMKQALLEAGGVEDLVVLPPTRDLLDLTAERFWAILRDEVRPAHLIEGHTFTFGKGRAGTIARLREWSSASDVTLHVIDPVEIPLLDLQLAPVSSSLVRWLMARGRMRDAAICLGRGYALRGRVVPGHQRGRAIGMPTANLRVSDQLVPADGVYVGRCTIDGRCFPAAVSIGTMPTFGDNQRQIEAHFPGFSGDLYGRDLDLEIVDWIREQRKYDDLEALKAQLARDVEWTRRRFATPLHAPIAVA